MWQRVLHPGVRWNGTDEDMIEDIQIRVKPEVAASPGQLSEAVRDKLRKGTKLNDYRIIRRSIDARQQQIYINLTVRVATDGDVEVKSDWTAVDFRPVNDGARRIIIVGAGPAGLFAALEALRHGMRPILIERGYDVDTRRIDLAQISRQKKINPKSNYCFGEGGAGAYSDGKLYTRSKKRGNIREVLELLVQHGASEDILIDAHPHIGSDRLPHVIRNIRRTILDNGGEVHFETCVESLDIQDGKVRGVVTDKGIFAGDAVVLATGHSAHDTFRALYRQGFPMEAKGVAIGVRLEHPQQLIDRIQYHNQQGRGKYLPAAEYSFVTQCEGRGVYSFCMCPGGVVVPAGSAAGELVVNGMSASARAGHFANSGMVVEIHPGDFPEYSDAGALEILELQEHLEQGMFRACGEGIVAPAQRMTDFVEGRVSKTLPQTSYAPGVQSMDFNNLLPEFISRRLAQGLKDFGRKARGFMSPEGILIGLESRTSSPVRMPRDAEGMYSIGYENVFPAGEGAGYAGGIVSAAMDGMKCVRAWSTSTLNAFNKQALNQQQCQ